MRNHCLNCNIDWEADTRRQYCDKCSDYLSGLKFETGTFNVVHKVWSGDKTVSRGYQKHLQTRVIDDDGNTLSGEKGLSFMKKKGDTYAARLKDYYEPKP